MIRVRKLPVVVTTERFDLQEGTPLPEGVEPVKDAADCYRYFVTTLEGLVEVLPGEWIMTGVVGELYPIKERILRASYVAICFECEREYNIQEAMAGMTRCESCELQEVAT